MGPETVNVGDELQVNGEPVTVTSVETTQEAQPVDLEVPTKVEEKRMPTSKEISEWRARNFTVRHATVLACDHKLDLRRIPNTHCFYCWYAFLESNPEGVASVHELLQQGGTKAVEAMHGKKFVKMYGQYIQKKLMQLREAPAPQPESSIEGGQLEVLDIAKEAQSAQNIQIEG